MQEYLLTFQRAFACYCFKDIESECLELEFVTNVIHTPLPVEEFRSDLDATWLGRLTKSIVCGTVIVCKCLQSEIRFSFFSQTAAIRALVLNKNNQN